ncbi:hypothetical protein ABID59_004554 [Bradyrhizobium sp. S3.3.6]|uniref:hypothetical protein n=1 Tax=Bradyrhizobium sp. S3.3.6 TaxID=3156429 RepID=UPI00339897C3
MSTKRSLTAGVFILSSSLLFSQSPADAGGWGHGPNLGGYHPFYRPVPDKPLDGLKQGVNDTGKAIEKAGPMIARPFEQTAQSIKDPWGWQKRTERWKNEGLAAAEKAKNDALDFASRALDATTKEVRLAIGSFTLVSVLAIAASFFRRRKATRATKRVPLVHPLHA